MVQAFTPRNPRRTLVFLGISALAAAAALVIGLDGNRPANTLAYLSATALVLAFAHPWWQPRSFKHLFYASGLGFAALVALHGLFDVGAGATAGFAPLAAALEGLSVLAFLGAVYLCPCGLVIGLGGALITYVKGAVDRRAAAA